MIDNPLFYAVAIPVVLLNALSKGAFGVAMGILAVPLIGLTMPIGQAAGVLLPSLLLMDVLAWWVYRKTWDGATMKRLLPGAAVGLAVGALTFHVLPEGAVRGIVGTVAIAFTLHYWLRRPRGGVGHRPPDWLGVAAGGLSGFTSFIAHAGGPPATMYLLPQRLEKSLHTGTSVVYFTALNVIKLPLYAWLSLLGRSNLLSGLLLMPLVPLGLGLGVLLHRALTPEPFYRVCYALVLLAGLKLLYDGLAAALGAA